MEKREAFFTTIAQEAIMGIMAFDPETEDCVFMNRLACELLENGLQEDAPLHYRLENLIYDGGAFDTKVIRPLTVEMLKSEGLFQDVMVRKINGQRFIANVGVKRVQFDDGTTRVIVMFQDITIQKKLQREVQAKQEEIHKAFTELLEQNRQLKELDHAKDKFIALTTHELRTPLSAIVATAEVLKLKFYENETQRDEFIETIHEQSLHLMELVNDILDFAKIRAGKMDFFIEEIDLFKLTVKLLQNFDHMANQEGVVLAIESSSVSTVGYIDSLRYKEVVNNVVSNAIKYNRRGGRVDVKFSLSDQMLRVSVTDTGQGIPSNKLHHVFNEFETVGKMSSHHKGTGLGMPISKRYMNAIGGDLTLVSFEGVGTTFFIDIPVTRVLSDESYRSRSESGFDDSVDGATDGMDLAADGDLAAAESKKTA